MSGPSDYGLPEKCPACGGAMKVRLYTRDPHVSCDVCDFLICCLGVGAKKPSKPENFFFWGPGVFGFEDEEMSLDEFQRFLKLRSFQ